VVIADDDDAVCTGVSRLLSPDCDVIARAADAEALFDVVARLRPDVVLLDFSLPGELNGLDVGRRLAAGTPPVAVLALTADDDEHLRRAAREAGFAGYVWKLEVATQLLDAIYAVVDRAATPAEDGMA
jgi:two-component system, NarL family, response regulator NreC